MIKKNKNTIPWTYVISDLNGEEIIRTFFEKKKNCKKQTKLNLGLKEKETESD